MPGSFSTIEITVLLRSFIQEPTWLGLGYETPSGAEGEMTELNSPLYARLLTEFTATGRSLVNSSALFWPDLGSVASVSYVVGYNAQIAGRVRFYAPIPDWWRGTNGVGSVVIPANGLVLGVDNVNG